MLISVTCRKCSCCFEVDSTYVGTMRKCPECAEKFLLDADTAAADGNDLDNLRGQKVACSECLRSFIPMDRRRFEDVVNCQFCNHELSIDEGIVLFGEVRDVERKIRKGLLLGIRDEVILQKISQSKVHIPNAEEALVGLLEENVDRLPFLRWEVLQFGGRETQFIKPRPYCDECQAAAPLQTLKITWRLSQTTVGSRSNLLLTVTAGVFFGALGSMMMRGGRREKHHRDKIGIHFLCDSCQSQYSRWRRFTRVRGPQDDQFNCLKAEPCHLHETESGMTLKKP